MIATKNAAPLRKLSTKYSGHLAEVNWYSTQLVWESDITLKGHHDLNIHTAQKKRRDQIRINRRLVTASFNFSGFHRLVIRCAAAITILIKTADCSIFSWLTFSAFFSAFSSFLFHLASVKFQRKITPKRNDNTIIQIFLKLFMKRYRKE